MRVRPPLSFTGGVWPGPCSYTGMTEARHWGARSGLLWLVVAACVSAACAKDISADVSGALQQVSLASAPAGVSPAVWADVQRFYMTRSYAAAWTGDEKQSAAALRVLRRAPEHGLPPARYVSVELPG